MNTEHLSRVDARAVEHLADPVQMHLSERHWGIEESGGESW